MGTHLGIFDKKRSVNAKVFYPLLIFPLVTMSSYVFFIYLFYKTPKAFAINLTLDSRKYPISSVYQALEDSCICHCLHTSTHTHLLLFLSTRASYHHKTVSMLIFRLPGSPAPVQITIGISLCCLHVISRVPSFPSLNSI